jgi:hypothetical protein
MLLSIINIGYLTNYGNESFGQTGVNPSIPPGLILNPATNPSIPPGLILNPATNPSIPPGLIFPQWTMPLGAQGQINGPLSLASQGLPQIILTPQGQIINVTSLIERVGAIPIILLQMINLQSQVEQTQKLVQLQLLQSQQPQWQLMQSQLLGQQLDQSKLQQGIPPLNQPISEISLLQQLQQLQQLKSQQLQLQQLQQAQQLQQQQLQQLQKSQK